MLSMTLLRFTSAAGLAISMLAMANNAALAQGDPIRIAQRAKSKTDDSKSISNSESIHISTRLKFELKAGGCKADLQLEYFQRDKVVQVSSTLNNAECAASRGEYTVQIKYRGDDNELKTRKYSEAWQRDDAKPIVQTREYFIGDNVDLVRVRTRGLSCTCAEDADASADSEQSKTDLAE